MKKLVLLLLITLLWINEIKAQQESLGTLNGSVMSEEGTPLPYVSVALKGTVYGSSTDQNGGFSINAPEGKYTLSISSVGMSKVEQEVKIKAGRIKELPEVTLYVSSQQLEGVKVEGIRNTYNLKETSSTLRLKTPILESPQNIQAIPKEVIKEQQLTDMLEGVTRNVSGAQMIEHWGTFARINMRGFKLPAFRNGMNIEMPWGPLAEDMSMVNRIEFVKGPAGFMLSAGEPGGFYNVVTKKPSLSAPKEFTVMTGSYNTLRSTLDVGGSLTKNNKLIYRLNLMGQLKGSHRDFEFNNRYTIAPSLQYNINPTTTITAEYTYQYSQVSVVGAAYVFSPDSFGGLPRSFTLAEPNIDPTQIHEHSTFLNLNKKLNENWEVTAQLGYVNYLQMGSSLWPDGVDSVGNIMRGIGIWDALNETKLGQVFVNGTIHSGPIQHHILGGMDLGHKNYFADWNQDGALGGNQPFNIYHPKHGIPSDSIPVFDRSKSIRKRAETNHMGQQYTAWYLQDEIGFFENRVRLTLAGRYTELNGWSYGTLTDNGAFTPRAGLSVSLDKNTSIYALYDQSFSPQGGMDAKGNTFKPVNGTDLEVGIKRNWLDGRWTSSLTVYQITKNNMLTADPENVNFSIQLGEVQSKGIEFDVRGEVVKGLSFILNYANTNVEITEDTDESKVGTPVAGHAKHITNGWLKYNLPEKLIPGLAFSLGYQYQVDRSSWSWGAENEGILPDYFRMDGAVSWQKDGFFIGLNVNNLLNEYLYSGSAYATYYYWQTEPGTNFRVNLGYKF